MARRGVVLLAVVLGTGCSSEDSEKPVGTSHACADGFQRDGSACTPILPAGECPAGTMGMFGHADCQPVGWLECPSGFEPDPSGWGCRPIVPEAACPAGTMAMLGETACRPVGWLECPSGFEPDPSGWGCHDVIPDAACAGATMARLGQSTCQPVGSCGGPFPPVDATLFVDDDYGPMEIDATHFASVGGALAVAAAGDVIAVEAGSYQGGMKIAAPVKVVGRCAEQVIFDGAGGDVTGVDASGVQGVVVEGVTLHDFRPGVGAIGGGELQVVDSVLDASRDLGVFAADAGTEITLTGSVVRGTRMTASGKFGFGVNVEAKGSVHLGDSEIAGNDRANVFVMDPGSTLSAEGAVIRLGQPDATGGLGHGVHVQGGGAKVTLTRSAIVENRTLGIYSNGAGTEIALTDSIVRDTAPDGAGKYGIGAQADQKGSLSIERSALVANHFLGMFLFDAGTTATLTSSVIRDTQPLAGAVAGRGIGVQDGPAVTITDSAIVDNHEYGVVAGGGGATLDVKGSLVKGTIRLPNGRYGFGLSIADGAKLDMTSSTLDANRTFGLAIAKAQSAAVVTGSLVTGTERGDGVVLLPDGDDDYRVQGIGVQEGGRLEIHDSAVLSNRNLGVYVAGSDEMGVPATVEADGLDVRGTLAADSMGEGNAAGVLVGFGAKLDLASGGLEDNSTAALLAMGAGSELTVSNAVVRGTIANNQGFFGRAAVAQDGARLVIDRSAMLENREIALFLASPGTSGSVTASLIDDTLPDGIGETGRGVSVDQAAALEMTRCTVTRSRELGLQIVAEGTSATLSDLLVDDTRARESDGAFGHGLLVQRQAQVTLARSRVSRSAVIGLAFADAAGLVVTSIVESNQVGIQVQDGSTLVTSGKAPDVVEAGRVYVSSDTRFLENAARIGSGSVPLPDPEEVIP